jgi:hypothetical protein
MSSSMMEARPTMTKLFQHQPRVWNSSAWATVCFSQSWRTRLKSAE